MRTSLPIRNQWSGLARPQKYEDKMNRQEPWQGPEIIAVQKELQTKIDHGVLRRL
jgi:hypothetical protein